MGGGGGCSARSLAAPFPQLAEGIFILDRSISTATGGTSSGSRGDLLLLEVPLERTCSFVNTRSGRRHPTQAASVLFTPVASATIRNLTSEHATAAGHDQEEASIRTRLVKFSFVTPGCKPGNRK